MKPVGRVTVVIPALYRHPRESAGLSGEAKAAADAIELHHRRIAPAMSAKLRWLSRK